MKTIETNNLILKETSVEYTNFFNLWENDKELIFYSEENEFSPQSIKEIEDFLKRIPSIEDMLHLTIFKKSTDQPIGYCMLAQIENFHKRAKIGITIGHKSEWGKSFAQEAIEGLLKYSFEELDLNRITAEVFSYNERAIRLFEKLGFLEEGRIRENIKKNDVFYDEIILGRLKKDWQKK